VTKFSFIGYGDTRGRRDGTELQYEHSLVVDGMLAAIKRLSTTAYPVKFVLQSGDAVVNGRDTKQWNTSFVSLINRLTTEGGVPYFLAPGNHDVTAAADLESPGRKEGLANYLSAMANLIPPTGAPHRLNGYPTYAFGYGNTFVIALDSNLGGDSTQLLWTKSQLEGLDRARYKNIVAFFHHPTFSSGPHGGSHVEGPTLALRELYMPLFRKHHVQLIFTGHEHLYEHWVERYTDGAGPQRIDMIVSGGGGAPLYAYQGEPDTADYLREYAGAKVQLEHLVKPGPNPGDNPYHFVVFQVDGSAISLEVIGVDWGSTFKPYRSAALALGGK
jgi:3',5'-cyclic AMP phosphodiesterase CpdA